MTYAVCFELVDGRSFENNYVTGAENPAEVEDEITEGDNYIVSNSRKLIQVKCAAVTALTIELREE